jgi:hypothetical protein
LVLLALATVLAFFGYAAWPRKSKRLPPFAGKAGEEAKPHLRLETDELSLHS